MHSRVSLHQVAFIGESTGHFLDFCREIGLHACTLVTPKLSASADLAAARDAVRQGDIAIGCINHPFAIHPDLERDTGKATAGLIQAVDIAAELGAPSIYMVTGGRGRLSWECAAERFASLIAPACEMADRYGIALMVENASPLTADIHIAHTLPDAVKLAKLADIGVCVELHACWFEADLREKLADALPLSWLVQVSDYVLGDRTTPCRAVPGDGAIPLEAILRDILDLGYTGLFDLELLGARIAGEGPPQACQRAARHLSVLLDKLGA